MFSLDHHEIYHMSEYTRKDNNPRLDLWRDKRLWKENASQLIRHKFYLHKNKSDVMYTHNKAFIVDKDELKSFVFD